MHTPTNIELSWPDAIYAQLPAGRHPPGRLCAGRRPQPADRAVPARTRTSHDVVLTTEEEGVGLVAGAALGGQRAALLMQSSGVGNCINMFSLIRNCGFPCFMLVTMRGEFAEFNPWQVPMGSITDACLKLCGFLTYRVDAPEEVEDDRGGRLRHGVRRQPGGRGAALAAPDRPQAMDALMMDRRALRARAARRSQRPPGGQRSRLGRPMTWPPAATIRSTSISGAPWAAPP